MWKKSHKRTGTDEEKVAYAKAKLGGHKSQQAFLDGWKSLKLVKGTERAQAQDTSSHTKSDVNQIRYGNYWKIAEWEGGLMNKEFGMHCADNICSTCYF